LVSGYASPQGIAKGFDKHICKTISKVIIDGEVSAAELWCSSSGKVDCVKSLEAGVYGIEWLAISLFNEMYFILAILDRNLGYTDNDALINATILEFQRVFDLYNRCSILDSKQIHRVAMEIFGCKVGRMF
jgi:hypothetical protein